MFIDPTTLENNIPIIEGIEKASARFVTQALVDFRESAIEIFTQETQGGEQNVTDLVADIAEDITREALDRVGLSRLDIRLYGKIDYKRARYVFHPEYAVKQALFVDSKAERNTGRRTATLQTAQTSMRILQDRGGPIEEQGTLPRILTTRDEQLLTTTIFVKYNYDITTDNRQRLIDITVATVPNGMLQDEYNPSTQDTIWIAGRNAPTRGEAFRVRLSFSRLGTKTPWRVQQIPMPPTLFAWRE